jgi:hypothetical protein
MMFAMQVCWQTYVAQEEVTEVYRRWSILKSRQLFWVWTFLHPHPTHMALGAHRILGY